MTENSSLRARIIQAGDQEFFHHGEGTIPDVYVAAAREALIYARHAINTKGWQTNGEWETADVCAELDHLLMRVV